MTKSNYIRYKQNWYNTASLDSIIKHITRGIKVIDVTEDVTEEVTGGNMVTGDTEAIQDLLQLNSELEDIIDSYNN